MGPSLLSGVIHQRIIISYMPYDAENPMAPPELKHEPEMVRYTRGLVHEMGGLAVGVSKLFEQANIQINVEGETERWQKEGQGALLVGDHRNGLEFAPLVAQLGNWEREDGHFIAKPFALQSRILGSFASQVSLPVIPDELTKERERKLNRDLHWRLRYRDSLPTREQARAVNHKTLMDSAKLVGDGEVVAIFPVGGVMKASQPWRRGIGKIVENFSEEARDQVTIVPFRFDSFSRLALARSLNRVSHGNNVKPSTITLRLGRQGSANELLGDEREPDAVTAILRQQFLSSLEGAK